MKTSRINSSDRPGRIPVTWEDCVWFPPVVKVVKHPSASGRRVRRRGQIVPNSTLCGARPFNEPFMKTNTPNSRRFSGFTLIELLVVIAIIAILAAMLLPALGRMKTRAKVTQAKTEMSQIAVAINSYESTYNGRFPVPPGIVMGENDVTFGAGIARLPTVVSVPTNAAVIAILMDAETYGNGQPTPNKDHVLNLGRNHWLNAKPVSDNTLPGVGWDGEYRDPWGVPYIISMDLSTDDRCRDALYSRQNVSESNGASGFNGLTNPRPGNDSFEFPGQYLIWSAGPDKQFSIDPNPNAPPRGSAKVGVNKDNVLHWQ